MFKILILEDDKSTREEMLEFFTAEGFDTRALPDVASFRKSFLGIAPHLVILDVNLPDGDGYAVTSFVRENSSAQIIIVSGRLETIDKVVGLEVGADDYLSKPYIPRELLARVRARLRRAHKRTEPDVYAESLVLRFDGLTVSEGSRTVRREDGTELPLTTAEFELLRFLAANSNRVLSREVLMDNVKHSQSWVNDERAIDGLVSRVRKKIGEHAIRTVRNMGYLFALQVEKGIE
ncbi:MAG: hypothetical protein RLZZ227_2427 [Pseudomonadota bacterium]|jgi:DNA-binding response OmpR family regulator